MLIAQISDMHVKPAGELLYGTIDTYGMLAAALADIAALDPRPDLVVASGDLVADGMPAEYAALRALFDELPLPYFLLPGNHDIRDTLRDAFPEQPWDRKGEFLQYAVEDYPLRLIALDTVVPGAPGGRLCDGRLGWLAARLDEAPDRPTAIFMHHPPFVTGIEYMDGMVLENPAGAGGCTGVARPGRAHPMRPSAPADPDHAGPHPGQRRTVHMLPDPAQAERFARDRPDPRAAGLPAPFMAT